MKLKSGKFLVHDRGKLRVTDEVHDYDYVGGWVSANGRVKQFSRLLRPNDAIHLIQSNGWDSMEKAENYVTNPNTIPYWPSMDEYEIQGLVPRSYERRCECGSEKARSIGHSTWCPKYNAR